MKRQKPLFWLLIVIGIVRAGTALLQQFDNGGGFGGSWSGYLLGLFLIGAAFFIWQKKPSETDNQEDTQSDA